MLVEIRVLYCFFLQRCVGFSRLSLYRLRLRRRDWQKDLSNPVSGLAFRAN